MKLLCTKVACLSIVASSLALNVEAKERVVEKYRRSSLHMVLMETDEPISEKGALLESWKNFPFPDKYDQIKIGFDYANMGKPKNSFNNIIKEFNDGKFALPTNLKDLNALKEAFSDKSYNEEYQRKLDSLCTENKIAHQLIKEWYKIQEDGSYDLSLIKERGCYNASMLEMMATEGTLRGKDLLADAGEELIGNSFVTFTRLDFYENEPVARFTLELAKIAASQIPNALAQTAAVKGAEVAYSKMKDGYSAFTSTFLYKLQWNDSIESAFYDSFVEDKIDMEKFNNTPFALEFVGVDKASSKVLLAKDRSKEEIINVNIIKNTDKLFAKLQKNYDVFKPVVPIITNSPDLRADIGMKEGLEGGEKFEVLEAVFNPETKKTEYKKLGTVKANKKEIWDNRFQEDASNAASNNENIGTVFVGFKKAEPGMLLKQVK